MKDVKIGQIVQIKNKAETGLDKTKLYFVKDRLIRDDRTIIAPVEDKANEVNFLNKTVPISIISDDSTFIAYSPEEDCTYNLTLDYWTRALSISRRYKEYNIYVEDFYHDIRQGNECLPKYKFDNSLSDKENINNNNIMIAKFIEDKKLYLVNVNF